MEGEELLKEIDKLVDMSDEDLTVYLKTYIRGAVHHCRGRKKLSIAINKDPSYISKTLTRANIEGFSLCAQEIKGRYWDPQMGLKH